MFHNFQQAVDSGSQQQAAAGSADQQRAGQLAGRAAPGLGTQSVSSAQHQMLQQALQQNPELAAKLTNHLQPSNTQLPGTSHTGASTLQSQQQALLLQRQQQAAAAAAAAASGTLQAQQPAKQPVAMARPAVGFSSVAARTTSPAPATAPQTANRVAVSAADMLPAAKRKKRKMMDNRLPEKVAAYVPESALYTQLQDYERQIDACLMQKQAEVQDALDRPRHVAKKLRLYIYNTHSHQEASESASDPPSWAFIIQGKLVDPASATAAAGAAGQAAPASDYQPPQQPFTHYIRRLSAKLDSEQYSGGEEHVHWEKGQHVRNHQDSFEIRRRGSQDVEVQLQLEVDNQPERFNLSASLSAILGLKQATRASVLHTLWAYIKSHRLQNAQQPSQIDCNGQLAAVFQAKGLKLSSLGERITPHLRPVDPLTLRYTLRVSGSSPTHADSYDIDIEVPAPVANQATATLLQNLNTSREIEQLDQRIMTAVRKLHEHKRRRAFFLGFSQSPVDFINALVASQGRDLRYMKGEQGVEYEAMRRTDLFKGKWVEDAVLRHLYKRLAAG